MKRTILILILIAAASIARAAEQAPLDMTAATQFRLAVAAQFNKLSDADRERIVLLGFNAELVLRDTRGVMPGSAVDEATIAIRRTLLRGTR